MGLGVSPSCGGGGVCVGVGGVVASGAAAGTAAGAAAGAAGAACGGGAWGAAGRCLQILALGRNLHICVGAAGFLTHSVALEAV